VPRGQRDGSLRHILGFLDRTDIKNPTPLQSFLSSFVREPLQYITITILDIINNPVFYLQHNVSETEFCFRSEIGIDYLFGPAGYVPPKDGDSIQSSKFFVYAKKQDDE
jgi:hypothetical protein